MFQKTTTIAHIANHAPEFGTETGSLEYYGNALKNLFGKIEKYIITPIEVGDLSIESFQKAHQLMEAQSEKRKSCNDDKF